MMEITVTYDDSTRRLSPPDSDYGGTTLDASSTRITVKGLPSGYDARLEFDVSVEVTGSKKKVRPFLTLDADGSCVIPRTIFKGCKSDLRLPVQLVLKSDTEEYGSENILVFRITRAIAAFETVVESYEPDISGAFCQVEEDGGAITFTRLDGTTETIHVDDDFISWTSVVSAWPTSSEGGPYIPTTDAVEATFLKSKASAADRLLMTDEDGVIRADGPRVTNVWQDPTSDDALPTEKLVKLELDTKALDSEVVHIDRGTPVWSSAVTYHAGSTVIKDFELYISQNDGNLAHDPAEAETVWWSKVKGEGGGGGGDDPGAYRVFTLGDGSSTSFICNHGMNTLLVGHLLFEKDGRMRDSDATVERVDKDRVKVSFWSAPADKEWTLVVYRPGLGPENVVTSINGLVGDVIIDPLALGCLSIKEQDLTDAQKAQVRENISLGSAAVKDAGSSAGQVPVLGSDGKLPNAVLPSLALSEWMGNVDTKAMLVTLSDAEQGDWAGVTADPDVNNDGVYMLNGAYSDASAWVQLVGPGSVISVNGKSGVVVLTASDVGAVDDDTTINGKALDGAVVLDADDVGAVAKVDGITAGTHPVVTYGADGLVRTGRDLEADDIPGLPGSKITSGKVGVTYLPTGNAADALVKMPSAGTKGQSLMLNETATAFEWFTPSSSELAMFTGTITGDGATKTFTFSHGLKGTPDPSVFDSTGRKIPGADVSATASTITVRFYTAPASGETYSVRGIA